MAIMHNTPRLAHKVAIVTGASSGLGRAISLAYASHGAKLVVCADLQPSSKLEGEEEPTHEAINRLYGPNRAHFAEIDVAESSSMKAVVHEAVKLGGGRLDVMVNNAGLGTTARSTRLHEQEDQEWDTIMRVNVRGVYLGSKYALAQFVSQEPDASGKRGYLINVSSMLGLVGVSGGAGAYCASKGASLNLTKQLAIDYARDRIHCNALCPGFTKTSMTRGNWEDEEVDKQMKSMTPWGEWGNPDDVAKAAVFLASDDAAWVTGVGLPVDGGYLAQ